MIVTGLQLQQQQTYTKTHQRYNNSFILWTLSTTFTFLPFFLLSSLVLDFFFLLKPYVCLCVCVYIAKHELWELSQLS